MSKPPARVSVCLIMSTLPLFLLSIMKLSSASSIYFDPTHTVGTSVFFIFFNVCVGFGPWLYSQIVASIIRPVTKTINKESDRDTVLFLPYGMKILRWVPILDNVARFVWLVSTGGEGGER